MLHNGEIDGESILPPGWVQEATAWPTIGGELVDYGYMWWLLDEGAYAAIGIFGQFIYVHPEDNLVVAMWGAQPKPVGKDAVDEYLFFNALAAALR